MKYFQRLQRKQCTVPVHTLHLIINDIGVNYTFGGSDMEIESGSEKDETKKYQMIMILVNTIKSNITLIGYQRRKEV